MEGSIKDYATYRLRRAEEDLARAKKAQNEDDYKLSLNRSYYAIFHALRAVNSLERYDSSKHKGVISHFNVTHVKTGEFPKEISKMISRAMDCRQKSDYEDFYLASKSDSLEQLKNAEYILGLIKDYLKLKLGE